MQVSSAGSFRVFAPLAFFEKADAPKGQQRRIAGVISTELRDKQREIILQRGLDFAPFLRGGWFNDNHSRETVDVLGYPTEVKKFQKGDLLPDGQRAAANGTWAEGYLLETPKAQKVWDLALALKKAGNARRLGFSIEGQVLERAGANNEIVAKAEVRNVAVTNCFPGPTRVIGAGEKVTRRWYSGPMVEVVLRSGEKLSGTPNHPVLTERGWVALGDLKEGNDRLGCARRDVVTATGVPTNEQDVPPTFEEVFNFAILRGSQTRPIRKGDFHGDVLVHSDVDIVLTNSALRAYLHSAFAQKFGEDSLPASDKKQSSLSGLSTAFSLLRTGFSSASRAIRGLSETGSLLWSSRGILAPVLIGQGPNDSGFSRFVVDRAPVQAETVRNGTCALSRAIRFDDLVDKRVFDFSGHVFNLDTAHGWYGANGIVAHNCPVGEDTRLEALAKSMEDVERGTTVEDAFAPFPELRPQAGQTRLDLMDGDTVMEKSEAVARIQAHLACDEEFAEQAYRSLCNLKQLGLL